MVRVSIFLIMLALFAGMVGCASSSQNLKIRTWYDLDAIRDNLGGHHILMNDLDSTTPGYTELASPTANQEKGWQPIGTFTIESGPEGFWGTFDGQGYEIRDLFIDRPGEIYVGLFSAVDEGGRIKSVGVVNTTVTGVDAVGSLAVGSLVGHNLGTVSDSYSSGSVTGFTYVGGLVGKNYGTVSNAHFTGFVTGSGMVGGLLGRNSGAVSNSYSTGNVTGDEFVGGLVGHNSGNVSGSYFTGSVIGNGRGIGGLVGQSFTGNVSNSHFTGAVTGSEWIGGLVGWNMAGVVSNSYSTGRVSGNVSVGGLVGENWYGTMSNSYYNYGEVLINSENIITIGALFGEDFEQWLDNDKFLDVNERLSQKNGYYMVNDVSDFKQLLAFGQNDTLKFRLTNDLDLVDEPNFYIPYLAGEFDGDGHKISNLSFNFNFASQVGLLGYLAPGGKVTQVGVENVNITGASQVGGLVGYNRGTVSNSYSSGNMTGEDRVGGLVGSNSDFATVSNSYSSGNMTGEDRVGGLVGSNSDFATVSNSYSSSSVTGNDAAGGLVGDNWGPVSNSYSTSSVSGSLKVGGLVGHNWGSVSNSYSTSNVTGDEYVGGLVGSNEVEDTISNSFWDTQTSGQATSAGGTGKTMVQMKDIATFSGAAWNITAVALNRTNPSYIWNIVDKQTYPFLSWQA